MARKRGRGVGPHGWRVIEGGAHSSRLDMAAANGKLGAAQLNQRFIADIAEISCSGGLDQARPVLRRDRPTSLDGARMALRNADRLPEGDRAAERLNNLFEGIHASSLQQVAALVNTARSKSIATLHGMAKSLKEIRKEQGARLKAVREKFFGSADGAAEENNWKKSTYRSHEGGWRTMGDDDAERYARAYRLRGAKVTAKEILFDSEDGISGARPVETLDKLEKILVALEDRDELDLDIAWHALLQAFPDLKERERDRTRLASPKRPVKAKN